MSKIEHTPEFSEPKPDNGADVKELAACYARVFLGDDDGKRVLNHLRREFGVGREVFVITASGRFDSFLAAKTDGQRDVMRTIESALRLGVPTLSNPTDQPQ